MILRLWGRRLLRFFNNYCDDVCNLDYDDDEYDYDYLVTTTSMNNDFSDYSAHGYDYDDDYCDYYTDGYDYYNDNIIHGAHCHYVSTIATTQRLRQPRLRPQ